MVVYVKKEIKEYSKFLFIFLILEMGMVLYEVVSEDE